MLAIIGRFCKVDDDFDIVRLVLQCLIPMGERDTARNQASQPAAVGTLQCIRCHLVMPVVGIDRTEDDVVLQDQRPVEATDIQTEVFVAAEAKQAANPVWRRFVRAPQRRRRALRCIPGSRRARNHQAPTRCRHDVEPRNHGSPEPWGCRCDDRGRTFHIRVARPSSRPAIRPDRSPLPAIDAVRMEMIVTVGQFARHGPRP